MTLSTRSDPGSSSGTETRIKKLKELRAAHDLEPVSDDEVDALVPMMADVSIEPFEIHILNFDFYTFMNYVLNKRNGGPGQDQGESAAKVRVIIHFACDTDDLDLNSLCEFLYRRSNDSVFKDLQIVYLLSSTFSSGADDTPHGKKALEMLLKQAKSVGASVEDLQDMLMEYDEDMMDVPVEGMD